MVDVTKSIKAVLILDIDGQRCLGRVFDEETCTRAFEKKLYMSTKMQKIKDEIMIIDETLVVHKFVTDLHFYVVGRKNENPLILDYLLRCLVESATELCSPKLLEKQILLDHLSKMVLVMDEIYDNGIILETDSNLVIQRICLKSNMAELTVAQKLQSASETFKFPWIRS